MKRIAIVASIFCAVAVLPNAQAAGSHLLGLYNKSDDYQQLVNIGLRSPAMGGYFYAHRVLSECSAVLPDLSKWEKAVGSGDQGPRLESIKLFKSRCANLSAQDLEPSRLRGISSQAAELTDPLLLAAKSYVRRDGLGEITTQARKEAAVKAILSVKDPLVVDDLGLRLVIDNEKSSGKTTFKINGNNIPLDSNIDAGLAMFLVPCEMGLNCDKKDFAVALPCASQGICDESRYSKVKRMTNDSGADYDGILRLAKSIAQSFTVDAQKATGVLK